MILALYVLGMVPTVIACQPNAGKQGGRTATAIVVLLWPFISWAVVFSALWEATRGVMRKPNG